MGTNRRLANVENLLWQSDMVSYAIRPSDAVYAFCARLLFAACGRAHQHPINENTRAGPQRTHFGFTHDLFPGSDCVDLCESVPCVNIASSNLRRRLLSQSKFSLYKESS